MATLTGTKIKDSYDGLLKAKDNDAIGVTKKVITDGLGNDTALELSQTEAKVNGNLEVTGTVTGSISGNAATATKLETARTISIGGDVAGSTTFDGSANASIVATIQPNSVELGADTTGDYVESVAAGTGIGVSGASGEGSVHTISNTGVISNIGGDGISVDAATGDVTITNDDKGSSQNIFKNIAVAGQDSVVAGSNNDTLTLEASTNVTITTDAATNKVTISANDTSINWSEIQDKPDPTITLDGDLSGSVTLTDLGDGTLTASVDSMNTANVVTAGGFATATGTSSDFLKADGTIDSNTYLTEAPAPNNATITFAGGTSMEPTIGSFTTDQATDATITINHGDTSTLNGVQGGSGDRVSSVTVDENGHVTAVEHSPILIETDFSNGITITQPSTGYDARLLVDPDGLSNNFTSSDGSINVSYSSFAQAIDITSNVSDPVAGTNINIGTNTVINLDSDISLNSISLTDEITTSGTYNYGSDSWNLRTVHAYDQGFKVERQANDGSGTWFTNYSLGGNPYGFNGLTMRAASADDLFFGRIGIQAGLSDSIYAGSDTPDNILAKVMLSNSPYTLAGFMAAGASFYGNTHMDFAPTGGDTSLLQGYFKPTDPYYGSGTYGGFIVHPANSLDGYLSGTLGSGGKLYSIVYNGGANVQIDNENWWDFSYDFSTGQTLMYTNGVQMGSLYLMGSDYRIKQNINQISTGAIDRVKQLNPVIFNWKSTDKFGWKDEEITHEGFIAHEVQEVIPSAATGNKDGDNLQTLRLDSIVAVLTKAVQEQQVIIEKLQADIELLKA